MTTAIGVDFINKKSRLLGKIVSYFHIWHGLYSSPTRGTQRLKNLSSGLAIVKQQHDMLLIERLDQAILDLINHPKKTQRTTDLGTLF